MDARRFVMHPIKMGALVCSINQQGRTENISTGALVNFTNMDYNADNISSCATLRVKYTSLVREGDLYLWMLVSYSEINAYSINGSKVL